MVLRSFIRAEWIKQTSSESATLFLSLGFVQRLAAKLGVMFLAAAYSKEAELAHHAAGSGVYLKALEQ